MSEQRGIIFDIHRFSINDGPGIRTTVFMKGCPLRCSWCHNSESQSPKPELSFDLDKCSNCGNCVTHCPSEVHAIAGDNHAVIFNKCNLSAKCIEVCPKNALKIIGKEMTVEEILAVVEKDKSYYKKSGGGVTISGGEPMQQFSFLMALVMELKIKDFQICLDTSGFASIGLIEQITPFIDLFHYDIKLVDKDSHVAYTGVNNDTILGNLHFLATRNKDIVLRCPIIPGINDHRSHFDQLSQIASKYASVKKIDLLPYHKMGARKACQLGNGQVLQTFNVPSESDKKKWKSWISRASDVEVSI